MSTIPNIGKIGIWSMELRFGEREARIAAAGELDALGYGAIWVPGGIGGDITGDLDVLLAATTRATIATGILNIWKHEPTDIAAWWKALPTSSQERVLLGIGVSHGPLIGEAWAKPLAVTADWIGKATAAGLPASSLCVAALGPKMVALSGKLPAGAHPYLVTPEHTAGARAILGPDALLAPEQGVILETDRDKAHALATAALEHYRRLPNYVNSWLRLGFTQDEIDTAAPRLLDGLFGWGSAEDVASRARAHLAAGANHVCLQLVTGASMDIPLALAGWRALAGVLL